jgi:hypothetical protein
MNSVRRTIVVRRPTRLPCGGDRASAESCSKERQDDFCQHLPLSGPTPYTTGRLTGRSYGDSAPRNRADPDSCNRDTSPGRSEGHYRRHIGPGRTGTGCSPDHTRSVRSLAVRNSANSARNLAGRHCPAGRTGHHSSSNHRHSYRRSHRRSRHCSRRSNPKDDTTNFPDNSNRSTLPAPWPLTKRTTSVS